MAWVMDVPDVLPSQLTGAASIPERGPRGGNLSLHVRRAWDFGPWTVTRGSRVVSVCCHGRGSVPAPTPTLLGAGNESAVWVRSKRLSLDWRGPPAFCVLQVQDQARLGTQGTLAAGPGPCPTVSLKFSGCLG